MGIRKLCQEDFTDLMLAKMECYAFEKKVERVVRRFLRIADRDYVQVEGHAERVAVVAERVAKLISADARFAFIVGLLHDIGKLNCRADLFRGQDINPGEYRHVKWHATAGYLRLHDINLEIALAVGLHHAFGKNGYGLSLQDLPRHVFGVSTAKVLQAAEIVAVCDHIDAALTRTTKPYGVALVEGGNLAARLLEKHPDSPLITEAAIKATEELYGVKIPTDK